MICAHCQAENFENAAFCDTCGAPLEFICDACGESNRPAAKFCKKCGRRLNQSPSPERKQTAKAISSGVQGPAHTAERILASREVLEGERKQVTVLFADIKGSTSFVERLDPEEVRKLLDPALEIMIAAVHHYEGTVNQVLGDGIMALFGAPIAHEDHALRACYAAIDMQESMQRYSATTLGSHEIKIGVGLNSGEAVVRSISNDVNMDYSAVGSTTHLAARMEEMAAPGVILMTGLTLRSVEGLVKVKPLGDLQVKGFSKAIETYELIGISELRKRLHAAAARGLSDFVGRDSEVGFFERVLQQAHDGHGQILALCGEPGLGKSRLVYEFTHRHLPPGWAVVEGNSASYGRATPYYPLIELLRRYFEIREKETDQAIRAKVEGHLMRLDGRLTDAIAPVLALLGALPSTNESDLSDIPATNSANSKILQAIRNFNRMEPQQRRRATLDALKRIVIRESLKQPLILLMEDLHWIDSETQAFLDSVVESLPMARIVLLVNYRPGYNHGWADKTYYTLLRVDPLTFNAADELLQYLLGDDENLRALKESLIDRTEGNPFFLEECVRSLVEAGALMGDRGAYRMVDNIQTINLPSTVQAVLADRIDRLPLEEKHLLQTAAVIGVKVPLPVLRAVANLPEEALHRYLSDLQASEFLYETSLFPEIEYTFKHALTNEAVYGFLLQDQKKLLHQKIVGVLEEIARDDLETHIETLARHALRGEAWEKAVIYMKRAGNKAVSQSSFRNAVRRFEQALDALKHLPETRESLSHAVDLRIEIRNALFILGDFRQGINYLEEAKTAATTLNDQGRLGTLFNLMTAHWNLSGDSEKAIVSGKQALDHTRSPEHLGLHIVTHYFLGAAYHNLGQYEQAVSVLERAIFLIGAQKYELFGTTGIVSVICRAWLVRGLAQLGKFEEATPYGEEAIQIAMEKDHPYSLVYAYYAVGALALLRGDFDRSIGVLERGLKLSEKAEIPVQRPLVASCLGAAYASVGRLNEALRLLEGAVEDTESMKRRAGQAMRIAWLSAAYMLADRRDQAETLAGRGLELASESKDQGSRAWLLGILGDLKARCGLPDAAETHYWEALQLAQQLRMRPLLAHCRLGLGRVHAHSDLPKARSELVEAAELYRSMSMPFWLSQAELSLSELG